MVNYVFNGVYHVFCEQSRRVTQFFARAGPWGGRRHSSDRSRPSIGGKRLFGAFMCVAMMTCISGKAARAAETDSYRIPRINGIRIDGDHLDWQQNGKAFQANLLISATGDLPQDSQFNARMQLAWDERGLLVLVRVTDPTPFEVANERRLFEGDSVEFFLAPAVGDLQHYLLVAAPGRVKEHPQLRRYFFDKRNNGVPLPDAPRLETELVSRVAADGYVMELRIPWSNMNVTPHMGMKFGFQTYVMDGSQKGVYTACWYPRADTHLDRTDSMMTLTLGDVASPPFDKTARASSTHISVVTTTDYAGKPASMKADETGILKGELTRSGGYAVSRFKLPPSHNSFTASVFIGDLPFDQVLIPATDALLYETVEQAKPEFYQYLFRGPEFPRYGMRKPQAIADAVGKYTLTARFYDSSYQLVKQADKPGRYAGVLELRPERGRPIVRFFTLYCAPEDLKITNLAVPYWSLSSLEDIGRIGSLPGTRNDGALEEASKVPKKGDVGPQAARVLAARNSPDDFLPNAKSAEETDREWWLGWKRHYYGVEGDPIQLLRPRIVEGHGAPVLKEGTAAEAGIDPEVLNKLDAICRSLPCKGLSICIERNGIAFFHRAYGQAPGGRMTLETPCMVGSITKTFSGSMMMMFVDQGLVKLDDLAEKYLPALRNHSVKTPLTVRMLYTHTSGLQGHYGDEFPDLAERVADQYAALRIPTPFLYNSVGSAVGAEIMGMITGDQHDRLMREKLLQPLGIDQSKLKIHGSGTGATGPAFEFAKLGQMLAAKGRYGQYQFFSEATFSQMVPKPLTMILGDNADNTAGIGFNRDTKENFGNGAYGHAGDNDCYLWIDSRTGIVLIMLSPWEGKMSDEQRKKLTDALRSIVPASANATSVEG
jgi:CubicO group peptidase (beta-lactamase class C family)